MMLLNESVWALENRNCPNRYTASDEMQQGDVTFSLCLSSSDFATRQCMQTKKPRMDNSGVDLLDVVHAVSHPHVIRVSLPPFLPSFFPHPCPPSCIRHCSRNAHICASRRARRMAFSCSHQPSASHCPLQEVANILLRSRTSMTRSRNQRLI